eukprot:3209947-Lingulodinium_polyedra.AAC.1
MTSIMRSAMQRKSLRSFRGLAIRSVLLPLVPLLQSGRDLDFRSGQCRGNAPQKGWRRCDVKK